MLRNLEYRLMAGVDFPPEKHHPVLFPPLHSFLVPCVQKPFFHGDFRSEGILLGSLMLSSDGTGGFYGLEEHYLR